MYNPRHFAAGLSANVSITWSNDLHLGAAGIYKEGTELYSYCKHTNVRLLFFTVYIYPSYQVLKTYNQLRVN